MISFPNGLLAAADEWSSQGKKLTETDMKLVQAVLEKEGPVLLKHCKSRGPGGSACLVFNDIGKLRDYLLTSASPGDAIRIWVVEKLLENHPMNTVVSGRCADERGEVPGSEA